MHKEVENLTEFMKFVDEFITQYSNNIKIYWSARKSSEKESKEENIKIRLVLVLSNKYSKVYFKNWVNRKEYLGIMSRLKRFRDNSEVYFPIIQYERLAVGDNIEVVFLENELRRI